MNFFYQPLAVIISYLLGSIPFGIIFSKLFSDVDVRTVGSGNIGATNVMRAAGKKAAILTLLSDCLKGVLPVLVVKIVLQDDWTTVACAAAAILGHNFPIYLKFKGGKGVATSYGVVLAIVPKIGVICLIAWLAAALLWRYSSLSALVSFALFPILIFLTVPESKPLGLLSLFVFSMIYYRHRENIRRLIAGTEPKIGKK